MYYNNGEDMKEVRYIVANRRKLLGGTAQGSLILVDFLETIRNQHIS